MPFHDELVRAGNGGDRRMSRHLQNQRIVQAARPLQNRSAPGATTENRDAFGLASRDLHLGFHLIGVTDDDEMFARFPKAEDFPAVPGFTPVEQRLITCEILGGRRKREIE